MSPIHISTDLDGATFAILGRKGRVFRAWAEQETSISDMTETALRCVAGLLLRQENPTDELRFVDSVSEKLLRTVQAERRTRLICS
jgi:hypothetical protein